MHKNNYKIAANCFNIPVVGFAVKDRERLCLNSVHLQTERNFALCPDFHTVQALSKSTHGFDNRLDLTNFYVKLISFKVHYTTAV